MRKMRFLIEREGEREGEGQEREGKGEYDLEYQKNFKKNSMRKYEENAIKTKH
jgi:hypothetical protein